jgi:uncharacterized 2Fe-2S/4Fe-4S cluster protein (DUF4445 family)
LLSAAAQQAGVELSVPCGGQGRCGRCSVQVVEGMVHRRSTVRLSDEDVARGYALGCQTTIESDVTVFVPLEEKIERRLTTNLVASVVCPPVGFSSLVRRVKLTLPPPSLDNQVDDWSRMQTAFRQQTGIPGLLASLAVLRQVGSVLRQGNWKVTAVIELPLQEKYLQDEAIDSYPARLIALHPGDIPDGEPLWGAAVDIGTTTVTVWLVNLVTGDVCSQAVEYNGQIKRGEDVISRIIYASRDSASLAEMQSLVLDSINTLIEQVCQAGQIQSTEIVRIVVAANSTMMHFFLGIPAESIRLSPFITAVNNFPLIKACEVGLQAHPEAMVDCLPGTASYVGSDISAGVLACGLDRASEISLFMDVGTNGETVLGSRDWMVTCACSAGPAFEGAGVQDGMRASAGAIEETWINPDNLELTYSTIGGSRPRGLCGSGLISLLSELYIRGVIDKAGHFNPILANPRLREGNHGLEYVVAWGSETEHGKDIVLTPVDIDNLMRAKAAMYAGFDVLAEQVGVSLDSIQQVLVGGSFGRYINLETAVQIGLLPDLPWDRFRFLGNTSVRGAYYALVDRKSRGQLERIAEKMTYIELSADNSFYHAFMSALFLPHTDLTRFPSAVR